MFQQKKSEEGYKQPHYAIPTTEEILLKMGGAKRLTKLDASNAYWQIPIDESRFQWFLAMVDYLPKFTQNLSSHTTHLRKLLKKDSVRSFEKIHRQEIDILKNPVTKPPVLKFSGYKLHTKISCGA